VGRFGPFAGCARYPECDYIKKDGPPPPDPLPFEVKCLKCSDGHLVPRRARRTGSLFWGCSRYPKCDYTISREPLGALHDVDGGPVARTNEGAICLLCGSAINLPADGPVVDRRLAGGPANPEALVRPARGGARRGGASRTGSARGSGARTPRTTTRTTTPRKTTSTRTSGDGAGPPGER
jgi:hypothetical protein